MHKNSFRNFIVYLSDYLSFILFAVTTSFIFYFLIIDTSYPEMVVVFENEWLLFFVSIVASVEIMALFFSLFYFKLKKLLYFSRATEIKISFQLTVRFICLSCVVFIIRIISAFVFFSPFLLSVSAIFLLLENGISQNVLFILAAGSLLLFITSVFSYFIFIQKFSFLKFSFTKYPFMPIKKLWALSDETADGNLFSLFRFKFRMIPKKIVSLLIFPAIKFLPSCLYDTYNFIYEKANPYPHKVNTEKTVVFYFKPVRDT